MQDIIEDISRGYKKIANPFLPVYGEIIEWMKRDLLPAQDKIAYRDIAQNLSKLRDVISSAELLGPTPFVANMNICLLSFEDNFYMDESHKKEWDILKQKLSNQLADFKKTKYYEPKRFVY